MSKLLEKMCKSLRQGAEATEAALDVRRISFRQGLGSSAQGPGSMSRDAHRYYLMLVE